MDMSRVCLLLMRLPASEEEGERIIGLALRALNEGGGAAIYLLGEGVFWAKGEMPRRLLRGAMEKGAEVSAGERDLLARGIAKDAVDQRVCVEEDIEGAIVEDVMYSSDRVVSW